MSSPGHPHHAVPASLTEDGFLGGKLKLLQPELLRYGRMSPSVDVYAFGVMSESCRVVCAARCLLHPRSAGANPYKIVLGEVRQRLMATRRRMEELLAGHSPDADAGAARSGLGWAGLAGGGQQLC